MLRCLHLVAQALQILALATQLRSMALQQPVLHLQVGGPGRQFVHRRRRRLLPTRSPRAWGALPTAAVGPTPCLSGPLLGRGALFRRCGQLRGSFPQAQLRLKRQVWLTATPAMGSLRVATRARAEPAVQHIQRKVIARASIPHLQL
jgi:hypothetical protein